jgi:iron complex transport system ATP-binding protein
MDEPTAHLDLKHQIAALETARRFADDGGGILCILHDLGLAHQFADEVVLLKSGKVVARGAPEMTMRPHELGALFDVSADRIASLMQAPRPKPPAAATRSIRAS